MTQPRTPAPPADIWYLDRGNLGMTVEHMAREGADPSELGRLVEKPWQYTRTWDGPDYVHAGRCPR